MQYLEIIIIIIFSQCLKVSVIKLINLVVTKTSNEIERRYVFFNKMTYFYFFLIRELFFMYKTYALVSHLKHNRRFHTIRNQNKKQICLTNF
jgi:hypothetical protein